MYNGLSNNDMKGGIRDMDKILTFISIVILSMALGIIHVRYIRNKIYGKNIEVEEKQNKKGKRYFYIFLIILCVIMIIMAVVSFLLAQPRFIISRGIMFVFATIAILLLFDSIDSFSIGNILSLKIKV